MSDAKSLNNPPTKCSPINGHVPTNIERATPAFIRENLENWDEKILKLRAARLKTSEERAALVEDKPLFLVHAEKRARVEGCSVETILEQFADELVYSKYPTSECFLPDEIAEYVERGTLPDDKRLSHTDICSACSMLLAASLPKGIDDILTEFSSSRNQQSSKQQSAIASFFKTLTDKGAAILLPILLLLIGYGVFFVVDRQSALQTVLSDPLAWFFLITGTCLYIMAWKGLTAYQIPRSWTTASIIGLVLIGLVYVNIRQIRSTSAAEVALAFKWAQDRTESLALKAIQQRQTTGQFPNKKQAAAIVGSKMANAGDLSVEAKNSQQAATYTLTAPNLKGQIVAEIGPDGGTITWEDGSKVLSQLQVLTATVKTVDTGTSTDTAPTVTFVNGSSYRVNLDDPSQLRPGAHVVAAIDPNTSSVESCLVISKNFPPPNIRP